MKKGLLIIDTLFFLDLLSIVLLVAFEHNWIALFVAAGCFILSLCMFISEHDDLTSFAAWITLGFALIPVWFLVDMDPVSPWFCAAADMAIFVIFAIVGSFRIYDGVQPF